MKQFLIYGIVLFKDCFLLMYQFLLDKSRDIRNWREGCNCISYGHNRKLTVNPTYQEIVKKIQGVSLSEAEIILDQFIDKLYQEHQRDIELTLKYAQKDFDIKFKEACTNIEYMTGKPIYRSDFKIYLTTFPRGPYNYEEGSMMMCIFWNVHDYLGMFLHELQHFQIYAYYRYILIGLTNDEFNEIKESMTVLLNDFYPNLLHKPDRGYAKHQELRGQIYNYWKNNKDFEQTLLFAKDMLISKREIL